MKTHSKHTKTLRGLALAALLAPAAFTSAQAQNSVVVELYTSQGCSSCPAADKILSTLANRPNVIALTMNVDYWDYLGWKDDLALPGNAKRQRKYAKMMRSRHVYTPQMMIDGKMDVIGSRRSQVDSAVASYAGNTDSAQVDAQLSGDSIQVSVSPRVPVGGEAVVWLVGFDASVTKQIGGGENNGRSIEYSNVVREWREAARWDGTTPMTFQSARPAGQSGFAVIVQKGEVGEILGATQVNY